MKYYCIPKRKCGEFVGRMEKVLDTYRKEYADDEVLVCMDETSKQLTGEIVTPIPGRPGRPEIHDFEYFRNGVSSLFVFHAPLENWRRVTVTDRRTRQDWARQVQRLVDEDFPDRRITLVMDNLNTHRLGSLYETFPPDEASRIASRLDMVFTPKHGSWLNIAEIEIGVLDRQCIGGRIADRETLEREVAAWQKDRNGAKAKVNWRFTSDEARIRLKSLYPEIQCG